MSFSSINVSNEEALNADRKKSNRKIADSDVSVQKAILDSLNQGHFEINVQDGQNTIQSSSSSSSSNESTTDGEDCVMMQTKQIFTRDILNSMLPLTDPITYKEARMVEKCCM